MAEISGIRLLLFVCPKVSLHLSKETPRNLTISRLLVEISGIEPLTS